MTVERIGEAHRRVAMVCAAGLAAACSAAPEASAPPPGKRIVILSVATAPDARPGPIRGQVRCGDEALPALPPCLADDMPLAEAVLACGPVEATIDRGASHYRRVKFPAGLSDRFPGFPADVDIVRCVQGRVGFAFSAGLATDSEDALDADPAPFRRLHSNRPAARRVE